MMENTHKLFLILENLKYEDKNTPTSLKNVQENLETIKKYIKLNLSEICEQSLKTNINYYSISEEHTVSWTYVCYLFYILLGISENVNFESTEKDDLISLRNTNDLAKAINDASVYGIRMYLPKEMCDSPIFKVNGIPKEDDDSECLKVGLNFLEKILKIKTLTSGNALDSVVLDAMAGIYTVFVGNQSPEVVENCSNFLNYLWENTSKEKYFKNLLILKSIKDLPLPIQKKLHFDLLEKLTQENGFNILVRNMVQPSKGKDESPSWERHEVVAKIVAHTSHSSKFIAKILPQIFKFIFMCLREDDDLCLVGAGVITLQKLSLVNENYKLEIEKEIEKCLIVLTEPVDVLTGSVLMDHHEFKLLINFLFTCFCTSPLKCLPSEYIIRYLPLLFNIYNQLQNDCIEQGQIKTLIVQCLANREKSDLQTIIKDIFSSDLNSNRKYKTLHSRVSINFNERFSTYTIQIAPMELNNTYEISNILPHILKSSNNNILIYNVFIAILNLLDSYEEPHKAEANIDLLQDEDELNEFISNKYKIRMSVLTCLTELITYKSFYSQFNENPREILELIRNFIKTRLERNAFDTEIDQNLSIVLAIFQEFLEHSKDNSVYKDFLGILKNFLKQVKNTTTKHQIETIISLIEGGVSNVEIGQSKYNFARSLVSENQPHLRVYGITQLINLLNDKDEETLSNKHAILAMALHVLRDEESYTYLNCVRLLVALTVVLESEVLETLSAEYLNKDEKIEFRLKIGESILKVTEDLGPLSYKYKRILINCFLFGSKQFENEFRASSLANLATVCRILSYQVHNFFQELLFTIDSILQTDKYLPSRRAAVMVISQLLFGMENLVDFQEYLLPLYRYLKNIIENDKDEITRVHATNGLKSLNEKCKSFLFPEEKTIKEIKIFGIKDEGAKKKSIFEI